MSAVLVSTGVAPTLSLTASAAEAQSVTIQSMAYDDGPTFTASGMNEASFGFRMPVFNGGLNTWGEVAADLSVKVKENGAWVDIDSVDRFVYNSNWGHWSDSGFNGYWFKVSETTQLQLYSKSNPEVTLDYTLVLNKADAASITTLEPVAGTTISANRTGSGFIAFPNGIAGGGSYPTDAESLVVYVKSVNAPDSAYVNIDNNAASGWIYNTNFGVEQYGYWFTVKDSGSINVKVALKGYEQINQIYTITYSDTNRTDYTVHANGSTTIVADAATGACGVVFPYLGGTSDDNLPTNSELGNFVLQYFDGANWVEFSNSAASGWFYQGNGYVSYSSKNQWGYFDDYVYGLWFQPVTEDFKLRIGYPTNGEAGGLVGSNYIEYQFVGAPDAFRPEDANVGDITVGGLGSNADALDGWTLCYQDEFNGNALDMNSWSYNTGYFLDPSDPNTYGWGNNEAEYYTSDADNIYVSDGKLHLVAKYDPYTFTCTDAAQTRVTADYSSGKIISKNKVQFTYGRIDFCAKLPAGNGLWPALWLLPNDDIYGTWASSGEIDVMEARGRVTNSTSGTIHYGGTWPNNRYTGTDYVFPDGTTFDDGFHVYSVIWEEDNITWYVDGKFFQYIPSSQWYSANSPTDTAPFDQNFYIIMNLAVGGWFDGNLLPDAGFSQAEMQVDYVRVYKAEGKENVGSIIVPQGGNTQEPATEPGTAPGTGTEPDGNEQGGETPGVFVPSDESGLIYNSDGTVTFYLQAQDTEFGPMVYYGANLDDPALYKMAGAFLQKDASLGDDYFSYTTGASYAASDVLSYLFSYTPLSGGGRIDSAIVSTTLSGAGAGSQGSGQTSEPTSPEEPTNSWEQPESGTVVGNEEYGFYKNTDGSLTFYIYANEQEMAPLVFWGFDVEDPQLWKLSGAGMVRTGAAEGYYTYTVPQVQGGNVSYMFGYTPLGQTGRRDTAIVTQSVN